MKLLLDECVVHDLKKDLTGHEVATVIEAGFGGLENGELLRAASGTYDAFITVDRNLLYFLPYPERFALCSSPRLWHYSPRTIPTLS